jgi:outer membrane protein assembly factor BamB
VFDPAAFSGEGLVVFGTSNCGNPDPTHVEAESEGVYALRAATGALVWEFHPRPYNDDDDDYGASANLLPGGLVGNGGKDGRYYAFDRLTGTRPWTSHPAQSGHVNAQFAIGGIIGTPAVGEVNGEPAIFLSSALSTPIGDPNTMTPDPTLAEDPQRMLSLHAISAVDGRILWRSAVARPSFGAPTYANGIVFVPGTVSFSLQAYNANDGTLLAAQPLTGAPSSSPTIVGDAIFIGTGTSIDPLPSQSQQHGLHAFSIPAAPIVPGQGILLAPQANELDAYDLAAALPTTTRTTPIHAHDHAAGTGHDTNGQNCAITQADGSVRYVAGHDNDQDLDPGVDGHPSGLFQGWALHAPTGGVVGEWTMTDKLVPTYNFTDPPNDHLPTTPGCAFSEGQRSRHRRTTCSVLVDIGVGAFDVRVVLAVRLLPRRAGQLLARLALLRTRQQPHHGGYLAVDSDGSVLVPESGPLERRA